VTRPAQVQKRRKKNGYNSGSTKDQILSAIGSGNSDLAGTAASDQRRLGLGSRLDSVSVSKPGFFDQPRLAMAKKSRSSTGAQSIDGA
jgi:hypothetical protein